MLRTLLFLAMLGVTAIIAAGFFGALHPAFDTLANFRLHLSAGLVALALLWALRRHWRPALVFAAIGIAGVASCASGLPLPQDRYRPSAEDAVHTAFAMNLLWNNRDIPAVTNRIAALDPEILLLTEFSWQWVPPIRELSQRYPHQMQCPEWGKIGGSVILSKFPLADDAAPDRCGDYASAGFADFMIGGVPVTFGIVHLRWPWPASGPRQIDRLEPMLKALPANVLVAGDFNSVTWSHSVERFARMGGLEIVGGIGPTWGPSLPVDGRLWQWPHHVGLPLDNVMARGAVKIVSANRLESLGSDHLPILIEFVVK